MSNIYLTSSRNAENLYLPGDSPYESGSMSGTLAWNTESNTTGTDDEIRAEIERHARDCMAAVNELNFDQMSYPWTRVAPHFRMLHPIGDRRQAMSRADALEDFYHICKANPDHQIRVGDVSAVIRRKDGEKIAEVYMNAEATGLPGLGDGVSRKTVARFEYRQINGQWMAVSESTMDGMGELGIGG